VVLYGANNNWFAACANSRSRYLAFDAVKLLDGGRNKWELDGRGARRGDILGQSRFSGGTGMKSRDRWLHQRTVTVGQTNESLWRQR
jgi:3-mercaptopyruvate sulfurtransferase SseA